MSDFSACRAARASKRSRAWKRRSPTDEAIAAKLPAGTPLPRALTARLQAAVEAPLTTHLAEGRIGSSEVLATTLPQLTGPALAKRFDDVKAQRLYADNYRAFKRRRSLLLLWLQHQVLLRRAGLG